MVKPRYPPEEYATELRDRLDDYEVTLAKSPERECECIETAMVATGRHQDPELLRKAEMLELYLAASSVVALEEDGVAVPHGAGIHADNVAEHVLGTLLILARNSTTGVRQCAEARWQHYQSFGELGALTIIVVGLGAIGTTVAE